MKKLLMLLFVLMVSTSLVARMNNLKYHGLNKLTQQRIKTSLSNDNDKGFLYHSRTQRYLQKTIQMNAETYDIVIVQEYVGSTWENSERYVYTSGLDIYDILNFFELIDEAEDGLNSGLSLDEIYDVFYEFADMSQLTYLLYQVAEGGNWSDVSELIGTLNSNQQVETLVFKEKENGSWVESGKVDFTYTASGDIDYFILSSIIEEGGGLEEVVKWQNTYNSNDLVTKEEISFNSILLAKTVSNTITIWSKLVETDYVYTDFNEPSISTMKFVLFGQSEPADFYRILNAYNAQQQIVSTI